MSEGMRSPDGAWTWDGSTWRASVPYESAARRARWTQRALKLIIAFGICGLVGWALALLVPGQLAQHSRVPTSGLGAFTSLMLILGTAGFYPAFVLCAACFIAWFQRIYRNLPAVGSPRQHSVAWAAYVWFIPFLNIYLPLRTVQEAWDASHLRSPQQARFLSGVKVDRPLRLWWTFFFGTAVLSRFAPVDFTTAGRVVTSSEWAFAITAFYIVGAVLAIRMIRELQEAQDIAAGVAPPLVSAPTPDNPSPRADTEEYFPNYL